MNLNPIQIYISSDASNDPCVLAISRLWAKNGIKVQFETDNPLYSESNAASDKTEDIQQNIQLTFDRFSMFSLARNNRYVTDIMWLSTIKKYIPLIMMDNTSLVFLFFMSFGVCGMTTLYIDLVKYGIEKQAGEFFNIAAIKFITPIVTNIILAGKAGTSMASQIQTMHMKEELRIIQLMDIDVDKAFLHAIFSSFVISSLFLTLIAIISTLLGGGIAWVMLGESARYFYNYCIKNIELKEILHTLLKSIFTGITTGFVVCLYGVYGKPKEDNVLYTTSKVFEYSLILGVLVHLVCRVMLRV